jgi:hypothetical protein
MSQQVGQLASTDSLNQRTEARHSANGQAQTSKYRLKRFEAGDDTSAGKCNRSAKESYFGTLVANAENA